jgi:hypothetical protein
MQNLWKWLLGAAAAVAAGFGAYSWTSEPVGPDASDPAAHTAPADEETGNIIRDKLDPREEK